MKFHPFLIGSILLLPLSACAQMSPSDKETHAVPTSIAATLSPQASSSPVVSSRPSPTPASMVELFETKEIRFRTDETVWKKVSNSDGVSTYEERVSKQGVVAFRGEMTMPTTLKRVAAVLNDPAIRKEWVDALLETHTVELISASERLEYNHTQVPWPFHDRDFLYRVKVKVNRKPATMLISMASEEDSREPPRSGIVRGQILHAFYYMKELPGTEPSTQVVIEMAADPKGAIPLWMVNLTQKRWPHHTLLALKKRALRADLVVSKEIEDYFN